jgi:hypothetical protein
MLVAIRPNMKNVISGDVKFTFSTRLQNITSQDNTILHRHRREKLKPHVPYYIKMKFRVERVNIHGITLFTLICIIQVFYFHDEVIFYFIYSLYLP